MAGREESTRRDILSGGWFRPGEARSARIHVSSAVVAALPGRTEEVIGRIRALPDTEVAAHEGNRIVVVMEASTSDELGARLISISLIEGVVAANMVFEQSDAEEHAS